MGLSTEDVIVRSMLLDYNSDELPDYDQNFQEWLDKSAPASAREMISEAPATELAPQLRSAATLSGPVYDRIVSESYVGWQIPELASELAIILNRLADEVEALAHG